MTEQAEKIDQLVAGYLGRAERALGGLPETQRAELLGDLREHIEAERAELPAQSEAAIRVILDRLGDPEEIAAAALAEPGRPQATAVLPQAPAVLPQATAVLPVPRRPLGALGWSLIAVASVLVFACVLLSVFSVFIRSTSDSSPATVQAPSSAPTSDSLSGAVPPSGVLPPSSAAPPAGAVSPPAPSPTS